MYATAMPIVVGGLKQGDLAISRNHADLRVFLHDALFFGHTKDYRSLAACPLPGLAAYNLCILRLDTRNRPTVETICGWEFRGAPQKQLWLLVSRGHMRMLVPPVRTQQVPVGSREMMAAGWEAGTTRSLRVWVRRPLGPPLH